MTAEELYRQATHRGLRLETRGDKLVVAPGNRLTPEFADMLRKHKADLLDWLEGRVESLNPDCKSWLHVAKQVLAGEFDGANPSITKSLAIGLRKIPQPVRRKVIARLMEGAG